MATAWLEFHEGPDAGKRLEIPAGEEVVLGRSSECGIVVAASSVSRKHARLRRGDGGFVLEDLGSANGTLVNGQPLAGPVALKHEDRLSFGSVQATFVSPPPPPAPPPPPPAPAADATIAVAPSPKPAPPSAPPP
ncbi:MAG: FHA domain-containing protein, partial [Candidatus Binatia bacterium]